MQHIGAVTKSYGHPGTAASQNDLLRERLPELAQAPDELIDLLSTELWDAAACRRKCHGCNDFTSCWRDGDGKGRVVKVSIVDRKLQIEHVICKPRQVHEAREQQERSLIASGLTEKERSYTFENYPDQQRERHPTIFKRAYDFAHGYESGPAKGLNLFGPPGIGKTHLLRAVINRMNDRGIPAVYVKTKRIMDKLKNTIREGGNVDAVLEAYKRAPVLAMDEVGQEKMSDYTLDSVLDILDFRAENGLPTFIATNFSLDEMYQRYYNADTAKQIDALRSRVSVLAIPAMMIGEDHRANFEEFLGPEVVE